MRSPSVIPVLGLAAILMAGCAQDNILLRAQPAVPQDPSVSRLAAACTGTDAYGGWRIRGYTRHIVRVDVEEIVTGQPRAFLTMAGVADRAQSAVTRSVFLAPPGSRAQCGGVSLETIVHGSRAVLGGSSGDSMEWRMEFSPGPGRPPVDAVQLRGEIPIGADGGGTARVPFFAMGRSFIANLTVSPGPEWHAERTRARAAEADATAPGPFSRRLPDEQPFRTLQDTERDAIRQRNGTR